MPHSPRQTQRMGHSSHLAPGSVAAPADHVPVPVGAALQGASLGVVVDPNQAEPLGIAEGPLEVVHEGPDEVAANVGAPRPGAGDGGYVLGQVRRSVVVLDEPV